MKKMNSFSQAEPAPTDANKPNATAKSTGKLSKSFSKSSSISISKDDPKQDPLEKEETLEQKFKKFEGEGVTFKAKLIGSELVMEPRGDKMCQNSIQRLKAIIKGQKVHKQRIVMKISYNGVKVYDEKTNEILHHHEVPQISFIASDDTDARTFGYVCDVPNKAHQFICFKTNGPALQVMSVISSLFEAVLEEKNKNKKKEEEEEEEEKAQAAGVTGAPTSSTPTSGDIKYKSAMDTSDLISSTEVSQNNNEFGRSNKNMPTGQELAQKSTNEGATLKKANSRSYFDDLKDLQITGDSGIMDSTSFSEWGANLSQSGMSRTNSAAQMSRTNSGADGLSRTNSAGGGLLFEANNHGGAQPPASLFYQATPISTGLTTNNNNSSNTHTAASTPMSPFGVSPSDPYFAKPQQPIVSQAMLIPPRQTPGAASGGGYLFAQQPTPSMMVPIHHNNNHYNQNQTHNSYNQHQFQQQQSQQHQHQVGPNAASFGAFFEQPAHSNMIVGSAPMNQLSHHQMSQHARFSSSMVAELHQRLGSSAASIQSTGSAGTLSRQTNPFDDDFFA